MGKAIRSAMAKWAEVGLGSLPKSYAPPNNVYEQSTIDVVYEQCPSIVSMCSDYFESSPDAYSIDPMNPSLLQIPRTTSGYAINAIDSLRMLSVLASAGLWAHFIHPDDVFDIPKENGKNNDYHRNAQSKKWRAKSEGGTGLYTDLLDWIKQCRSHYPWLRFATTYQANAIIQKYLR